VEETRLLRRLVDDLRTLASAEAGRLSLHREPTDLARLAEDVIAGFRPASIASGVHLAMHQAGDVPPVDVDPERLRQVLTNLVANALRYTPGGASVTIAVAAVCDTTRVSDSDTGRGMAADELDRVFERFYRSPDSRGSGLGLPIARELVRAHGGEIRAASREGGGTTITVELPD
jgi:signal transduction histidine kinase